MININDLCIVNYCHANCVPFMNICRLPEKDAFLLAEKMATANPNTTAYVRFSDFKNYYPRRMMQDKYLYESFINLGGKPKEQHPLSFVLHGSDYLYRWFGNGIINKIKIENIPSEYISFTLGDSMSAFKRDGRLTMYTKQMLSEILYNYHGDIDDFMAEIVEKHYYIEVQLWNDDYCLKDFNNKVSN